MKTKIFEKIDGKIYEICKAEKNDISLNENLEVAKADLVVAQERVANIQTEIDLYNTTMAK